MHIRKTIRALVRADPLDSCIGSEERVVFFPTAGDFRAARGSGCWNVPVHGWIYTPAEFSRLRRAGLWFVKHLLSRSARRDAPAMALFKERAGALLADNERWRRVAVCLGDGVFKLRRSAASGHFHGRLELPAAQVQALLGAASPRAGDPSAGAWLSFRALTRDDDSRIFEGRVLLLPPEGLSVISDIDDTIKVTQVASRRKMLANTFLHEFTSVPQMAALYQRWAQCGAAFHYVSASPWHLYPFLAEFLAGRHFPEGTFHLRDLRLMPSDLRRTLRPSRRIKFRHARTLLERFPRRRFILIGDSGESDPAIYARLWRDFPRQVEKICIRNVAGDSPSAPRWAQIRAQIPRDKFQLFAHPDEIKCP